MFAFLKQTTLAAVVATLLPMAASATTLNPGDTVDMVGSYDFSQTFGGSDVAGVYTFTFWNYNAVNSNIAITDATIQAKNLAFGNFLTGFPGVSFKWATDTVAFLSNVGTASIAGASHTILANSSEVLTITFGDPTVRQGRTASSKGTLTLSISADPAPVPLPAGGLLLLGALGGIAALRRRKTV